MTTVDHRIEVAPGARWYDDLATATWVDVSSRVVAQGSLFSVTRGRSDVLVRTPQSSQLSALTLDSADGALTPLNAASPYYPDVAPGLPVRVSIKNTVGTWVPIFTGFVDSLDPSLLGDLPDWTQVGASAVDGWARVMQGGERRTLRDRVLIALCTGVPLSEALTASTQREVFPGGVPEPSGPLANSGLTVSYQAWGVGWWAAVAGGALPWSSPGACSILAESGGPDPVPISATNTSVFASDRFGGIVNAVSGALSLSARCMAGAFNQVRQQVGLGRPPVQLLPASICDPTSTSGWTVPGGTLTQVAASSLTWPTHWDAWNPATGLRSTEAAGPAGALVWTGVVAGSLATPRFPVSIPAGSNVAVQVACDTRGSGGQSEFAVGLGVSWFDGSGTLLGSSNLGSGQPTVGTGPFWISTTFPDPVPAGAVTGQLSISRSSAGDVTIGLHSLGLYVAEMSGSTARAPARWHAPADSSSLHLWLQTPLQAGVASAYGLSGGANSDLWLLGSLTADVFADGAPHLVAWNMAPGLVDPLAASGIRPAVWIDGIEQTVTWHVSQAPGSGYWNGYTTASCRVFEDPGDSTAATHVLFAVTGVDKATTPPDMQLMHRMLKWWGPPQVGDPSQVVTNGPTDQVMGSLLDSLGWPVSMRALSPGVADGMVDWSTTPQGADSANLGDYSTAVSEVVSAEFGWADVDASGDLRWLSRRWYDPDGDGLVAAKYRLTWRTGVAGKVTYFTPLGQAMADGQNVANVVIVSEVSDPPRAPITTLIDDDAVDQLGTREQLWTNLAWNTQAATDAVASEIAALTKITLLPSSVVLKAVGPADPMLDVILDLAPADVVTVAVPQQPAPDLTITAIVQQIAVATDGFTVTATLSLAICPGVDGGPTLYPDTTLYPATTLYPMGL